MPRTYVRVSSRASWQPTGMKNAIEELQKGRPLSTVANEFGVPRHTLRRHFQCQLKKEPCERKLGKQTVLGDKAERELVTHILELEDKGFGLTPKDVRQLVFEYAEEKKFSTALVMKRKWQEKIGGKGFELVIDN
jgi:hypothetical protein